MSGAASAPLAAYYDQWVQHQQPQYHPGGPVRPWMQSNVRPPAAVFPVPPDLLPPARPGPNYSALAGFWGLGGVPGMAENGMLDSTGMADNGGAAAQSAGPSSAASSGFSGQ